MKKIFTILAAVLLTASVFGQAPEKMSYQAVIRDADGQLVTDTKVGVRVRIQKYILGMPPSWQDVYVETHSVYKTNENGLLTLMIGTGEIVSGNFADIDWSYGRYNLKTEIDPEGGTNYYSITGSSPLLSVPYALHAKNAKTYKVGDFAQGGIVFWVDETGQHGLVAAKVDQDGGSGVRWYAGTYTHTMAYGDGPLSGEMNTVIIIANQGRGDGSTYAARICNELQVSEGGKTYGDWYLPSKEELNLMYKSKSTIDATATANGGSAFASAGYWSSTETNYNNAWLQGFHSGDQFSFSKLSTYRVRAVRAF